MISWLETYAKTHFFYLVLIAVGMIAFHSWLAEHDARLQAAQQVKIAEAQVNVAQSTIENLQTQISTNDAKAQKEIDTLEKTIAQVKTTQQAAQQLPTVTPNLPTPVTVQTDDSVTFPKEDVLPLFQDLADGKVAQTKLAQCQTDYSAEQQIAAQKDAQLAAKDSEIVVLKKKPGFWHQIGSTIKQVGVGVGIGLALGAHL